MIDDGARAIVVDPGEPGPVAAALDARRLELAAILVTHHHADHVGGVDALRAAPARAACSGRRTRRVPEPYDRAARRREGRGARPALRGHRRARAHRRPHRLLQPRRRRRADRLLRRHDVFGRLRQALRGHGGADARSRSPSWPQLPDATRVCCGHEYTLSNLRFARAVEPDNEDIARYEALCQSLRAAGKPTLPSDIGRERRVNPFLRVAEPTVVAAARAHGASKRERQRRAGRAQNLEERIPMTTRTEMQPRAAARFLLWLAAPILFLAGCVTVPAPTPTPAADAPPAAAAAAAAASAAASDAVATASAAAAAAPTPPRLRGRRAGRRAGAGRSAAPGRPPRPRRSCRARRPLGSRAARLRDARPRQRPGARARALVCVAPRLRRAHDGARRPLPVLHRRGAREARHADRAGAAAVHRERLQPAGDVGRAGLRHVAVHSRRPGATSS